MTDLSPVQFVDKLEAILREYPSLKTGTRLLDLLRAHYKWIYANRREIGRLVHVRNVAKRFYRLIYYIIDNDSNDEIKRLRAALYGMLLNTVHSQELAGQLTDDQIPALVARDLAKLQTIYMDSKASYTAANMFMFINNFSKCRLIY